MTTVGESISRVRSLIKGLTQDAFITDRLLFSLITKAAKFYLKRQDSLNQLLKYNSIFKTLPCVELIEIDKVEACCDVQSGVIIKRTREKLPNLMEGTYGPLLRSVISVDGSFFVYKTDPAQYTAMTKTTKFRYNKTKYFWYLNGYLYFPNVEWDAAKVEGIFEDDVTLFTCDENSQCSIRQDQQLALPEYLFMEIEQQVVSGFFTTAQMPADSAQDDKQNIIRT
jgi:hypothetical protein